MMKTVNELTGMNNGITQGVVKGLEQMLADLHVFYANLRGFHWNIVGPRFFELHKQFEVLYNEINEMTDEVAERMLQLGVKPENRLSVLIKRSAIQEQYELVTFEAIMPNLLDSYQYLMATERALIAEADKVNDYVTSDLMHGYLVGQEKLAWSLAAMMTK